MIAVAAALRESEPPALGATGVHGAPTSVSARALARTARSYGVAPSEALTAVAESAATNAPLAEHTLYPATGIALQLFRELEDGRLTGYSLLYQRVAEAGEPMASSFLAPALDVR